MRTWSAILWRRRRRSAQAREQVIQSGGVVLDPLRRRVQVDGYVVHLTSREAAVLGVLMARAGQVVYRPALVTAAWGSAQVDHHALDRLVARLRRRIEPSPLSPARLRHVGDTGYLFSSSHGPPLKPPR